MLSEESEKHYYALATNVNIIRRLSKTTVEAVYSEPSGPV